MPRSHIHESPRRFYFGLNLTDVPGKANFCSPIRMHYIRMVKESYGPIRIATYVLPWLIRRPVRECVTWALPRCDRFRTHYIHHVMNAVSTERVTPGLSRMVRMG